jgi:hypothetical protein
MEVGPAGYEFERNHTRTISARFGINFAKWFSGKKNFYQNQPNLHIFVKKILC